jgi:DNA-binding winged helix-turn-helix (wHTH) protein
MKDLIEIGEWSFSATCAELRRRGERRALEDRAGRLLFLLASRRGEVVTHNELIASVWSGRSVSANSVAVVIGDLRRALGDDAKAPRFIETVSKRGYRLVAAPLAQARAAPTRARVSVGLAGGAGALLLAGALAASTMNSPPRLAVAVRDVRNETGDGRYTPLARAVTELVVSDAAASPRALRVARAGGAPTRQLPILLKGRLIMWSGHPSVSLSAVDQRSGQVIWSAIAPGPEDSLPGQVHDQVEGLKATLAGERTPL